MHNSLFIALLAGLGGMLGWGLADFFAKTTIDKIGELRSLVWAHLFGVTYFGIAVIGQLLLGRTIEWPNHLTAWLGLAGFGILQMIIYWLVYIGFGKGQLAVLNPVFASYSGLVALISVIFLGETLHLGVGFALLAIFLGVMALNLDVKGLSSKRLKIAPGLAEVGLASLLAAGWTLGWNELVSGHDSLAYAFIMYGFMSLAALTAAKAKKVDLTKVEPRTWKFLCLVGLGEAIAYLAISWGFSATKLTSVVALVSGCFSLPTIILAYTFLKERLNYVQLSGVGLIVLGIAVVSLS